jgi:enoyl-CoA hydratase
MGWQTLQVDDRDGVRWIVIDRPGKLNALDRTVMVELGEAIDAAAGDASVHVVVVTGAGEKAFVAGADIAEFAGMTAAAAHDLAARGQALFARIERLAKPVIAAVNGFALGGGCELAMACHLRVASSNARFGQPEVKLGLIPGYGGTQRLPRLVGRGRALEMLLTGKMIDAATALAWGLVNAVVAPAELAAAVARLAAELAEVSPVAAGHCLDAVGLGADVPLERAMSHEADRFALCAASEDMREGVAAFLDKRPPRFLGR